MENKSLTVIFLFKLKEPVEMSLFSGTALESKPIIAMYTDAKVDGQHIKLILKSRSAGSIITKQLMDQLDYQVDCTVSARIITADGPEQLTHTCTSHVWPFQDYHSVSTTDQIRGRKEKIYLKNLPHKKDNNKGKEKEEENLTPTTYSPYAYSSLQPSNYCQSKLVCVDCGKKLLLMGACCGDDEEYSIATKLYSSAKAKDTTTSELLEIKNNSLLLSEPEYILTFNIFGNIEDDPEEFHEHYQQLALIKKKQEQHLEQLNTRLC
ncbi:hypothetical protein G9A89_010946 [Geosiphon pyriformis]|nr:hypothetical protein G9A89_010946 [Geosiphon pyriformis]